LLRRIRRRHFRLLSHCHFRYIAGYAVSPYAADGFHYFRHYFRLPPAAISHADS
jgi:hypothetical protein